MRVSEIFDDCVEILGYQDEEKVFARISDAVEALANKAWTWDGLEGWVDLCVGCDGSVSLPPEIETPLAVNIGGSPARFRNRWFEFHLNGPGTCGCSCDWTWDDRGQVPTIQDIIKPSQIIALSDNIADDNTRLRLYGWERLEGGQERPIYTVGPEKALTNRYLTASYVQPAYSTPVNLAINASDGLLKSSELIVANPNTGVSNFYRVVSRPTATTVRVVQSSLDNDATGTTIPDSSSLRTRTNEEGMLIPVRKGYPMPDPEAPLVCRVDRIIKPATKGFIQVMALDSGRDEGTLLAYLWPRHLESSYRRIKLGKNCQWVRMRYRKARLRITTQEDQILTNSRLAVLMMLRAIEYLRDESFEAGEKYEAKALQFLEEKQSNETPADVIRPQINLRTGLTVKNFC